MSGDLGDFSLIELFRVEAEGQIAVLTQGLLAAENGEADAATLEGLMRAAHSIKGAARIVGLDTAVTVAHAMEDCLVAAQAGELVLGREAIDGLLQGVDWLTQLSRLPEGDVAAWTASHDAELQAFVARLADVRAGVAPRAAPAAASPEPTPAPPPAPASSPTPAAAATVARAESPPDDTGPASTRTDDAPGEDRVLRVTADHLNQLLGLAGESLVEARRLQPFNRSLLRLKRMQHDLGRSLDRLRESLTGQAAVAETIAGYLEETHARALESREFLRERIDELDRYDRQAMQLSGRLYREALAVRMRPFADGVRPFPRMVRDLAHSLGKQARLLVVGERTQVDRDVLERLEAPLTHLLRNALDHGVETPAERLAAGKPPSGTVRLEARHRAGMLLITVGDDGRGIDLDVLRTSVVRKGLTTTETAAAMSQAELLDFLFLPGFSLKSTVTEISGRGVGLDVVQTLMKDLRGSVRLHAEPGRGAAFHLQLPLTLSVVRTLLVEIAGEPYALPLAMVSRVMRVPAAQIETLEGRPHVAHEGRRIGLVLAREVLELPEGPAGPERFVVVLGEKQARFGLVVDRFLGERELVLQPLDPRLGKVEDVAAGALMEDGSPVLVLDVEDLLRSMDRLITSGELGRWRVADSVTIARRRKRVLVVDDSLTVRELERKLLGARGYEVTVAVDGMEGWNAVRAGGFDLVVTDVDMPRMDGIALVRSIKADERLKALPVMIVSYKDREEDRRRGLDAGADYYLTKGSFHDESLLQAVADLIGGAEADT